MTSKAWQLGDDAAARYQEILVPAILGPFAQALVDWADLAQCQLVLDVGCGTGAAARFAAQNMPPSASVIGTDVNPGMIRVARALPAVPGAALQWREESAYALSLDDETADAILCAQTLQFLQERQKALAEMRRVLKSGAILYLSIWTPIEDNPYFAALVQAVARHISPETAAGLGAAFQLSNLYEILSQMHAAGFKDIKSETAELELPLPPVADFVPRHIHATPMSAGYEAATTETRQAILDELSEQLAGYQNGDGMRVPFRSYLFRALP